MRLEKQPKTPKVKAENQMQGAGREVCAQIENWVQLKQYVEWLPFEYHYTLECDYSPEIKDFEAKLSTRIGERKWVGEGFGPTEHAAVAQALKVMEEEYLEVETPPSHLN